MRHPAMAPIGVKMMTVEADGRDRLAGLDSDEADRAVLRSAIRLAADEWRPVSVKLSNGSTVSFDPERHVTKIISDDGMPF